MRRGFWCKGALSSAPDPHPFLLPSSRHSQGKGKLLSLSLSLTFLSFLSHPLPLGSGLHLLSFRLVPSAQIFAPSLLTKAHPQPGAGLRRQQLDFERAVSLSPQKPAQRPLSRQFDCFVMFCYIWLFCFVLFYVVSSWPLGGRKYKEV